LKYKARGVAHAVKLNLNLESEKILQKARNEFRRRLMIVAQAGGNDRSSNTVKFILVSQLLAASPV
jgi:hypothetical protein